MDIFNVQQVPTLQNKVNSTAHPVHPAHTVPALGELHLHSVLMEHILLATQHHARLAPPATPVPPLRRFLRCVVQVNVPMAVKPSAM